MARFSLLAVASAIGTYCGIAVFFIFSFYYNNAVAGGFALTSGIFAAISLHLTLIKSENRLMIWYSPKNLKALSVFGGICNIISLGLTIFYVTVAYTQHIPLMPVKDSFYLNAVWSGMTWKWSCTVTILSFKFARLLEFSTPFVIIQDME